MKIRVKNVKSNIAFFLVCMGLLFVPSVIRISVFKTQWALINLFTWLGILSLTKRYYKGGRVIVSQAEKCGVPNPVWIITLVILFLIESFLLPQFTTYSKIKYIYATLLPCYILYTSLPKDDVIHYVKIFAKMLTIASTIVVFCGVADLFLGAGIGKSIAEFSGVDSLIESIRQGRMVSYFGHPLLTSEIMILCFSFNTIISYCLKKESIFYTVYYSLVCVIGISLCGSKTGIILIAIEFAFLYVNKKGVKYLILVAVGIYWAYGYGLLDIVIGRFIYGFQSGDLTTGRNVALSLVLQSGSLKFNFFVGHAGSELSEKMIAALEYPPLRWAYLFGIWFAIIMCVILFVIPVVKTIQAKNIKILVVLLILILDVNSYNGITTHSDQMLLYCVSVCLLLNLGYILKGNEYENMRTSSKSIYFGRYTTGSNNNPE